MLKKTMKNSIEPCQICGDVGQEEFIMTCLNCREVREHIYCARVCFQSTPDMWLCDACRSSPGLLQISNPVTNQSKTVDDPIPDTDEDSSLVSNDTSPSSSKKQKSIFLAFPSPKRKCRTPRISVEKDIEEVNSQRSRSPPLCVFHRID